VRQLVPVHGADVVAVQLVTPDGLSRHRMCMSGLPDDGPMIATTPAAMDTSHAQGLDRDLARLVCFPSPSTSISAMIAVAERGCGR
jgi:hypothetical protein